MFNPQATHSNIDPEEVKKFQRLATQWWDLNGPCKPLHDLNPLRFSFIQSCCSLAERAILDVGCGGGILTESLSTVSSQVVGIDQCADTLTVAINHASGLATPPSYRLTTVEELAQQSPGSFDIITCMEMLEHVPSPTSILQSCAQLLKPNGHLIISTLNRTLKAFLFAIVGAEYILRLLPRGTHDYKRFIQPSELYQWATKFHFSLKHLKGIEYHPFTKRFSLSDQIKVNYLMHFQKEEMP